MSELSLKEAAKHSKVGRQAIYAAIKKGRLKAKKNHKGRFKIDPKDLEDYRITKFNRDYRMINGQKIYSIEDGKFSTTYTAKLFASVFRKPFPVARIYYLIKRGDLKAYKTGSAWVIKRDDAVTYYQKVLKGNPNQIAFA